MSRATRNGKRSAGFTLVESLITVAVLTVFMVGIFSLINKSQAHYRVETQKVDFTQQQREFIDQFTRDLHQAGYPTPGSQGLPPAAGGFAGVTAFPSSTDLTIQGDLDGTGVQTVEYVYTPACTCLQRIVNGQAFTVVENVAPPNAQEIFTGYDASGNTTTTLANIRSISVTLTVQAGVDADNRTPIQTTMTGMARLPNND